MMKRTFGGTLLVGALLLGGAAEAHAQVFTPTYMAPRASSDLGVYLSDGPGDFAVEGIIRRHFGGFDLGFRGGLADAGDVSGLIGAELRHPLAVASPIDLAVTGGVQGMFGDGSAVGFQGGLTIGHTFVGSGLAFTPYIHPRAGLVKYSRNADFDLRLLADVGFDLDISPRLALRFGISLDGRGADWGVGFAWR